MALIGAKRISPGLNKVDYNVFARKKCSGLDNQMGWIRSRRITKLGFSPSLSVSMSDGRSAA